MSGHNPGRTTSGQGAVGRGFRVQILVPNSDLAQSLCGSVWPWPTGLLGVSRRPGGGLETSAGSRLGLPLDHYSGRVVSVAQDMRVAADDYIRYQRASLVTQYWRATGLGRVRATWFCWKNGRGGDPRISVESCSAGGSWNIILRD